MKFKFNKKKLNSVLKKAGITLCTISLTGAIAVSSYDIYLNSKLDDIEISQKNVQVIEKYFENSNENPLIVVLNDSQGLNLNIGFWKNNYSEYLNEEIDNSVVINASSLRFNKTSHIDMLIDNNLSLEDIRKLNNVGAYAAFEKVATDSNLSPLKGVFGTIGETVFGEKSTPIDGDICISDLLKNTQEPIIIYSSGINDLMFLANANPSSLKKYDSDGNITDKYLYANEILNNSDAIETVICNIEKNFCKILSINPNCKIFALSIYLPKSLNNEDFEIFNEAINNYNKGLKELCEKYNICYIDEMSLGKEYSQSQSNFHINEIGHKQLASLLINEISENIKIKSNIQQEFQNPKNEYEGLSGYYNDLCEEVYDFSINSNLNNSDIYLKQLKEKISDAEICKQLIKK